MNAAFEVGQSSGSTSASVASDGSLHPDVVEARRTLDQLGVRAGDGPVRLEVDNLEYGAAVARVGAAKVRYRVGKLTPRKVGAFVAVWRRAPDGSTEPFPAEEDIDLLIITVREGPDFGVFVFPKAALVDHRIVSMGGRGGKRGFRVYPPWSVTTNPQAQRTRRWQGDFFIQLSGPGDIDTRRARRLFTAVS